jgi:hypothetical protein
MTVLSRRLRPRRLRLGALLLACSVSSAMAQAPAEHQHGAAPSGAVPEGELPPLGTGPSEQTGAAGALGDYTMTRDGSGTSWQPDSSPHEGIHGSFGSWSTMIHGYAFGIYDHQGGPRGDDQFFSESMLMGMAQRPLGFGQLTLRGMMSLDPFMGKGGYPLLLQTGETANGVTPLIDRQHPHDLFMELAGIYSAPVAENTSAFLYLGYPGEPALGPVTYMHRFSGMSDPEAPLGHHWLDSTHVAFGVVTAGLVYDRFKIEGSLFNGREPDQHRWNFDPLRLNSGSGRVSWNPSDDWSFQASYGYLKSPEQLEPGVDQHRITASATYNMKLDNGNWQTTFAWGQNIIQGETSNAFLFESALSWYGHTVFGRAENVDKNELFLPGDPLFGRSFNVSKFSLGYVYDVPVAEHFSLGVGGVASVFALPSALKAPYGSGPAAFSLFVRAKLL